MAEKGPNVSLGIYNCYVNDVGVLETLNWLNSAVIGAKSSAHIPMVQRATDDDNTPGNESNIIRNIHYH